MNAPFPSYRPTAPSSLSVSALDRIEVHLAEPDTGAWWWVELVSHVDALDDMWARHRADVEGSNGLHAHVLADAPRVAALVARLEIEHDRLATAIRDVRLRLGEISGDPDGVTEAVAATADLLARLRQHEVAAEDLLHEAYQVDLGGG